MGLGKRGWRVYIVDVSGRTELEARAMVDLTVRNVGEDVVDALKRRAAANGRSVEDEHRELLRAALPDPYVEFATRAQALRGRLISSTDSPGIIRTRRDGAL